VTAACVSDDDGGHGIGEGFYSMLPVRTCVLVCLCGEQCKGDTWEEAGAALDTHLLDEDVST